MSSVSVRDVSSAHTQIFLEHFYVNSAHSQFAIVPRPQSGAKGAYILSTEFVYLCLSTLQTLVVAPLTTPNVPVFAYSCILLNYMEIFRVYVMM